MSHARPAGWTMALVMALALTVSAHAGPTLDGVRLGTHALGPKVAPTDLNGRVVVFE